MNMAEATVAEWLLGFHHETTHRDQEWDLIWYTAHRLLMATFVCLCVSVCCSNMTDVLLTGLMETTSATAHSYTDTHRSPLAMSICPVHLKANTKRPQSHIHIDTHALLHAHSLVVTFTQQTHKATALSKAKYKECLFMDSLSHFWTNSDVLKRLSYVNLPKLSFMQFWRWQK